MRQEVWALMARPTWPTWINCWGHISPRFLCLLPAEGRAIVAHPPVRKIHYPFVAGGLHWICSFVLIERSGRGGREAAKGDPERTPICLTYQRTGRMLFPAARTQMARIFAIRIALTFLNDFPCGAMLLGQRQFEYGGRGGGGFPSQITYKGGGGGIQ